MNVVKLSLLFPSVIEYSVQGWKFIWNISFMYHWAGTLYNRSPTSFVLLYNHLVLLIDQ